MCTFISQIDLIDMRHLPHGEMKWILHCVDHWSKFNFAYAIESKTAINVANVLNMQIFPYFWCTSHTSLGQWSRIYVIEGLQAMWHIEIQKVSGQPRHLQSQGLVEHAHQKKLGGEIMKSKLKTPPWSEWLPKIACKLF